MDDKLKAAIEVTGTKSIPLIEDAFDAEYVSVPRNAWLSAVAVACFYRAEHPDDDAESVDEEWLRSIGFARYQQPAGSNIISLETLPGMYLHWDSENGFNLDGSLWDGENRGDVRKLCAALGIPLTG